MSSQDNLLEEEHHEFVNSEEFQYLMKERVENAFYYKFSRVAPEGFVLIPEVVLNSLKNSENWVQFKNDDNYIKNKTKEYLRNINP